MTGIRVGYARVSSTGQNLEIQIEALKKQGCSKIYQEKISGINSQRPELKECLNYLRDEDTLVVTRLDRLGRSTVDLCKIAKDLDAKGVHLRVIEQDIDTETPTGRFMFHMLAAVAEFENELRKERQAEGIAKAKANGIYVGRKCELTSEQVQELKLLKAEGWKTKDLMNRYKLSKSTIYRYLSSPT